MTILRGNVVKHYIHHRKITMSYDKITLKMYLKLKNDFRNVFLKPKNIGKLVLHKVVRPIGAEILPFQFPVAAILDFLHNGQQGSPQLVCGGF